MAEPVCALVRLGKLGYRNKARRVDNAVDHLLVALTTRQSISTMHQNIVLSRLLFLVQFLLSEFSWRRPL